MGNFKIGEKVVCINDKNQYNNSILINGDYVIKGSIYTIVGFSKDGGLLLEGVFGGKHYSGNEVGFIKERFRKLDYEFSENLLAEISEAMKSETIKN